MSRTHEDLGRSQSVPEASERAFGAVMTAALAVAGLLPLAQGGRARLWALAAGAAFLLLAGVRPVLLRPLNRVWQAIGRGLHRIVSPLVLGAVLYLVITPVALLMRLAGKDPLRLRWDPRADSYWIPRDSPGPGPGSMKNQF